MDFAVCQIRRTSWNDSRSYDAKLLYTVCAVEDKVISRFGRNTFNSVDLFQSNQCINPHKPTKGVLLVPTNSVK